MSLINKKDKLAARSKTPRSRVVTTRVRREKPTVQPTIQPIQIKQKSTFAKQEEISTTRKAELISPISLEKPGIVIGKKLSAVDSVVEFLVLEKGESLNDIIISHYSGVSASVVSIHWSHLSKSDFAAKGITMTSSGGIILTDDLQSYRLITESFPSGATLSIANNVLSNIFDRVHKNIYFYATCSVLGPTITAIKKSK